MPEFSPIFQLSTLDGINGFQIWGQKGTASGHAIAGLGDVNGDGFDDVFLSARFAAYNAHACGAGYVVFGKASGFPANIDVSNLNGTNGFRIDGESERDEAGLQLSEAGDINGDGLNDLVIGSKYAGAGGEAYVVFGKSGGFPAIIQPSSLDGANGFEIRGGPGEQAAAVLSAGDVNHDGFDDVLVGAPLTKVNGRQTGAIYVVFGKESGFPANFELSSINGSNGFLLAGKPGEYVGIYSGVGGGSGDFNGDGIDDIIAANHDSAYVVFGRTSGFAKTVQLSALNGNDGFKIINNGLVSEVGDINADGCDDFVLGTLGYPSTTSYVVFGRASGFGPSFNYEEESLDGSNGFRIISDNTRNNSLDTADAGDFNADGYDDLLIANRRAAPNGLSSGAVYVVFGKAGGFDPIVELSALDGNSGFKIAGAAYGDQLENVSSGGDVNHDGFDDIIVSTPWADPNGETSGSTYVIFGHRASGSVNRLGSVLAQTINGGTGNDTINGDGGSDKLIGWEGNDFYYLNDVNGPNGSLAYDAVIEAVGAGSDTVSVLSLDFRPGLDGYALAVNVENAVVRGSLNFALNGNSLKNTLTGNSAYNRLLGQDGNDRLYGANGADELNGGNGNDFLAGGAGRDTIAGGSGNDVFDYNVVGESSTTINSRDTILGFAINADRIDVSGIDAVPGGANDLFSFRGTATFNAAGQIRLQQSGGNTIVEINTVGTSVAEMTIVLMGITATALDVGEFIL